jgi:hypothetical protein
MILNLTQTENLPAKNSNLTIFLLNRREDSVSALSSSSSMRPKDKLASKLLNLAGYVGEKDGGGDEGSRSRHRSTSRKETHQFILHNIYVTNEHFYNLFISYVERVIIY